MNQRIRELATQADIWCDQNYPNSEFYDIHWEEKFAELIVRECADLFEVEYGKYAVSGNTVADVLKRHFGVEE